MAIFNLGHLMILAAVVWRLLFPAIAFPAYSVFADVSPPRTLRYFNSKSMSSDIFTQKAVAFISHGHQRV
jgi:hypothetical protein